MCFQNCCFSTRSYCALRGCPRFATEPQRYVISSEGRAVRPGGHQGHALHLELMWLSGGGGAFRVGVSDRVTAQRDDRDEAKTRE